MKILEVTYYEENDENLTENECWVNKSNVNLFIDGEITEIFNNSICEKENFKNCMNYLKRHYNNAKLEKTGTYPTGWDYMQFAIAE